jgi:hypothetical protein
MATSKAPANRVKAAPTPAATALEAYARVQKLLKVKPAAIDGVAAEQVDFLSDGGPMLLQAICLAFGELQSASEIDCISRVANKSYFAFQGKFLSRAVNRDLYVVDIPSVQLFFQILETHKGNTKEIHAAFKHWDKQDLQRVLYSMAIAFCCAIDIQKEGDKKTPGTFFEYFVGYVFACVLGVNPKRSTTFTHRNRAVTLPTDFMFDMGEDRTGFHVPVKTSTRERIIQVWAHQRVIDGVLGQDEYLGTPVFLTETKLDKEKKEVVEICLPDQWQLYQGHIAKLSRIYYLDLPEPYANLSLLAKRPISVQPFANFFLEAAALASIDASLAA